MASSKIDLSSESIQSTASSSHVQYIPCHIDHEGEANIGQYFKPYVATDEDSGMTASFRGYPLVGEEMKLPEGYTGVVLCETKSMESSERTLKPVTKFDKFTYWNWDRKPSTADKYQQAVGWMDIAAVIHE